MGRTACTEPQCLYSTAVPLLPLWTVQPVQSLSACTVQLYLYSPYGPYSLYRASVPVQYSYTSTPLWAVRPVQSLSACTVELYLYSPYGPYGLYRASVPVQGCTLAFLPIQYVSHAFWSDIIYQNTCSHLPVQCCCVKTQTVASSVQVTSAPLSI